MKTYYECIECNWTGDETEVMQAGTVELCPKCEADCMDSEDVLPVPDVIYLQRNADAIEITWCSDRISGSDAEYRLVK